MQNLGYTRSSRQADHTLLTPDTFVRAPLPGMSNATAIVHAGPAIGVRHQTAGHRRLTLVPQPSI